VYRRVHAEAPVYRYSKALLFSATRSQDAQGQQPEWIGAIDVARESAQARAYAAALPSDADRDALKVLMDFENSS
jgi:hypothetical protein